MKRCVLGLCVIVACASWASQVQGKGLLIPVEKDLPPLAMLNHRVNVTIEDQVATTKVEQTFRNHTSRELEATYVFPVPRGANVKEFAMWVGGKRVKGELLQADKAREIYTSIVRQTQDPGLLEYMGTDLLRLRVFPVPARGDQKVEVSYTSIARRDHEIVEYNYPLKTDGKAASTLEDFSMKLSLKSQHPIINIFSPTHAVSIKRTNDREAAIEFEKNQALLDKDFQFFYTTGGKDVGLTALMHRPISTEDGYFMLLISPRPELASSQQAPRDLVFVLDTSGSMLQENKLVQAKKALKHCLDGLSEKDRFALINFSTAVNRYREGLIAVDKEQIDAAKKWVDRLEATGGTAINDALLNALELQSKDEGRTFTVVFFTDGKPTIGETNPDKILANVGKKNTANTRIFTFGVGHDMNATLIDQLAEQTRAVSTFVRPEEDMEAKVSSFFGKISHPVLTNLKVTAGQGISLAEIYPPQLPDLFHGGQVIVLGRYHGTGHTALRLTGVIGKEPREYVHELDFAVKAEDKGFVEELWARRKVGYLLEQIRLNGEKKELMDEVTALAKKYGIATPYTSYLIVPDAPMPVAGGRGGAAANGPGAVGFRFGAGVPAGTTPPALARPNGEKPLSVAEAAKELQKAEGKGEGKGLAENRSKLADEALEHFAREAGGKPMDPNKAMTERERAIYAIQDTKRSKDAFDGAKRALAGGQVRQVQVDKLGVDLSCCVNSLKNQSRLQQTALKRVANRNCMEIGGVWIDEDFTEKLPVLTVKAMSDAYFRILERQPQVREVFQLGNHLVWVTPNNTALVIDTRDGKEQLADADIDKLFVAAK
jgi:Ca-activated chloride channel family protein